MYNVNDARSMQMVQLWHLLDLRFEFLEECSKKLVKLKDMGPYEQLLSINTFSSVIHLPLQNFNSYETIKPKQLQMMSTFQCLLL